MGNMMGLSSVTDKQLKYALHFYNNPKFHPWHEWFAWYPVRVVTFKDLELADFSSYHIKVYNWVWLKKIARRKVVDYLDGPGRETLGSRIYYEYTTLMDLLKHGH